MIDEVDIDGSGTIDLEEFIDLSDIKKVYEQKTSYYDNLYWNETNNLSNSKFDESPILKELFN